MVQLLDNMPMPVGDPVARKERQEYRERKQYDPLEGLPTEAWINYWSRLSDNVNASPVRLSVVSLTGQGASISATDMSDGSPSSGLYRINYYTRITRAATTSSSLTVTFDWTDGGVTPSQSGAAITGNTTTTQQNDVLFIRSDAASPIRYSTTYASVGGTSMQYQLYVVLERIQA